MEERTAASPLSHLLHASRDPEAARPRAIHNKRTRVAPSRPAGGPRGTDARLGAASLGEDSLARDGARGRATLYGAKAPFRIAPTDRSVPGFRIRAQRGNKQS